jgi:hypothetical protein
MIKLIERDRLTFECPEELRRSVDSERASFDSTPLEHENTTSTLAATGLALAKFKQTLNEPLTTTEVRAMRQGLRLSNVNPGYANVSTTTQNQLSNRQ